MKYGRTAAIAVIIALITTLSGAFSASAAIAPGTVSDEVTVLQSALAALGYFSESADGEYNAATEAAVKTFESTNGLPADGIADDGMLSKLQRVYLAAPRIEVTAERADIYSDTGIFAERIGTLEKGDSYVVLSTETVSGAVWYNFRYGSENGWISGNDVQYTEPQSTVGYFTTVRVEVPALDVRDGAGVFNPKVTTLRKGTVVAVKTSEEVWGTTWYCYEQEGEEYWINGDYVKLGKCVAERSEENAEFSETDTTTGATESTAASEAYEEEIEYTDSVFAHSDEYRLSKYYDALCRVQRTGDLRTDIAAVALSQVGYHEGSDINDVSGNSVGSANFTEYGVNYGTPNDYWCAMFIWWCARQAGVEESIIPKTEWAKTATFGCEYAAFGSGIEVQKGDILFIDNTGDEYEDHVALAVDVTADTITTVEGNTSNSVKKRTYSRSDGRTKGKDAVILYVGYPDYDGENKPSESYDTPCIVLSKAVQGYNGADGQYKGDIEPGEYLLLDEGRVGDVKWYQIAVGLDSNWIMEGKGVKKVMRDKAPISSIGSAATTETTTTVPTTAQTTKPAAEPKKVTATVQFARVNAVVLNLRCGPDSTYAKVAVAEKDSEFAVIGTRTSGETVWYNLIYKGNSVWASGDYLITRDVSTVVDYIDINSYVTDTPRYLSRTAEITDDAALLYIEASTASAPVAVLRKGVTYTVVGSGGNGTTTWHKINIDGIEGYISRYELLLTNHYTQIPDRNFAEKTPVIYLSPSKQGANPYIIGETSEKAEMEALGDIIYEKLKAYDCVVHIAPKTYSLEKRAEHAFSLDTDIYIAIHSNATGNATVHYGPSAYYFPGCEQSRVYAESIVESLNKVVPLGSNLNAQVINGMNLAGGCGYAEVREPGKLGMIGVLVETDFHDYEPTAQWLINEKEKAADAYVESLVNAFGLRLKDVSQS